MARYTGPKNKLSRRIGSDLGLKTNSVKLQRRLAVPPGQHGRKGTKKLSDYGIQLKEKQKVRFMYCILEKQFQLYYDQATKNPHATGEEMLRLLECRLDNAVYRLGLAPTRNASRQLIVHGHVKINNKKVDKPSCQVKIGQVITLSDKAVRIPAVADMIKDAKNIPDWLEKKGAVGKIVSMPERKHVNADINENLIVEYYSR